MDKKIVNWLLELFKTNDQEAFESISNEIEDLENRNYFELGLIDSFGIIILIEEIESYYSIRLTEKHFEQRKFSTIAGLAEIIEEEIC
tara:strand:- start:91 stop:354 length:264 start_codon:yes stop_codon:yes gene_type:complete